MAEILQEQLLEWGERYSKNKDITVRKIGSLLLESYDLIEELQERNQVLQAKLKVISKSSIGNKNGVLKELTRQNKILVEYKNLAEVLGLGKSKDKNKETIPSKTRTALQQISNRYLMAKSLRDKIDAIAGMVLAGASDEMAKRALKLSKSGGSSITGVDDE